MSGASRCRLLSLAILVLTTFVSPTSQRMDENGLKTETFLSPKVEHEPGSVSNKYLYDIGFPKGHIAVKRFDAEVVDEAGYSVPLHQAYIHHWAVRRYYKPLGHHSNNDSKTTYKLAMNAGVCDSLPQYFGLGAETRKTDTHVPDPYGIEVGNPPEGYEDAWVLNLHTIDTRGTVDSLRCLECKCELYNVTVDGFGDPIGDVYTGGIRCCYDGVRCRLKDGYSSDVTKVYYMKYTVTYVDWNPSIVPVKIYIFDVADTLEWRESLQRHHCWIEYEVESCSGSMTNEKCVVTKSVSVNLANGGDVIYAVAHQHIGGIGSTLYGEDGQTICSSFPIYGEGTEAGNEAGYIVGMTTCYPQPGSIKIVEGEMLTIASNYSARLSHTGVMGMFYILVAEPLQICNSTLQAQLEIGETTVNPADDL
nr:Stress up-regulated Nod 19 protein [Ipomoea batatas]